MKMISLVAMMALLSTTTFAAPPKSLPSNVKVPAKAPPPAAVPAPTPTPAPEPAVETPAPEPEAAAPEEATPESAAKPAEPAPAPALEPAPAPAPALTAEPSPAPEPEAVVAPTPEPTPAPTPAPEVLAEPAPIPLPPPAPVKDKRKTVATDRRNAFSFEAGGRALLYSFDYDVSLSRHFAIGLGVSHWYARVYRHGSVMRSTVVPVYVNYYFQSKVHRWFITAGVDGIFDAAKYDVYRTFGAGGAAGVAGGGYEIRSVKGLLFRAAAYGIAGTSFRTNIGASIGFTF